MIIIFGVLLYIVIIGIVILRIFKYKFQKLNKENIGLVVISGILLKLINIQETWFYFLLVVNIVLFVILIGGIIKSKH